jgi:hypothetical protein
MYPGVWLDDDVVVEARVIRNREIISNVIKQIQLTTKTFSITLNKNWIVSKHLETDQIKIVTNTKKKQSSSLLRNIWQFWLFWEIWTIPNPS